MTMCAIAGLIDIDTDEKTRDKLLTTMTRRGPDATGVWCRGSATLLHARLAVIDVENGAQPMQFDRFTICYNGELYNTGELRLELENLGHVFKTRSDTEVLLHGYAQWGQEVLERCNGIFAFGIWDRKEKELFLARDRMGVKPLFYSQALGGLVFASEIKTILACPGFKARIDAQGAAEILFLGPGRTPGCGVFRDVSEIEPGCCGVYRDGKLRIRRYWKLLDRPHTDTFEETKEKVRFLVLDAVRRQMVSDVPIGTFVSGGLDSSLITAICAREMEKQGKLLDTFSVDYTDNDKYFVPNKFQPNSDGDFIRLMETREKMNHHWCILSPEELVGEIENGTMARDLPGMADVDLSLIAFCREIKNHVTVALSGECADEIFGGYPWYRDPEVRSADGFPWAQNSVLRMEMAVPGLRDMGEEYIHSRYMQTCRESDILPGTSDLEKRMKEMVNLNFRWFMQTLLDRKDRMSMWSGLEVRVPFCDYRIAEYLYTVPWEMKDRNGKEKGLLRYAMEGFLPPEVLWRKKSPYPKTFDPRYLVLVSRRLKGVLQKKDAPLFALVDREKTGQVLTQDLPWPWYGQLMRRPQLICYLLQINFWLEHYHIDIEI